MGEINTAEILRSWDIAPDSVSLVSARGNTHWKVQAGERAFVVRAYRAEQTAASISYEIAVLGYLGDRGWPVALPLGGPVWREERAYVLFPLLAGTPRVSEDARDMRTRGRILAKLHHDLSGLDEVLGQRPDWLRSDEVVKPARWHDLERRLCELRMVEPALVSALRLQIDGVGDRLMDVTPFLASTVVHGDLIAQNLLFSGPDLSGVIDFDSTHVDFRATDLACARRSRHDEVVRGYLETSPLSEAELGCLGDLWKASVFEYLFRLLHPGHTSDMTHRELLWCVTQLEKTRPFSA